MHSGVREARESDLERIRQLIIDLATYERSAHEVKTTTEQLRVALFGPQPAAYALVAESDHEVVGFALFFRNFSTWEESTVSTSRISMSCPNIVGQG